MHKIKSQERKEKKEKEKVKYIYIYTRNNGECYRKSFTSQGNPIGIPSEVVERTSESLATTGGGGSTGGVVLRGEVR